MTPPLLRTAPHRHSISHTPACLVRPSPTMTASQSPCRAARETGRTDADPSSQCPKTCDKDKGSEIPTEDVKAEESGTELYNDQQNDHSLPNVGVTAATNVPLPDHQVRHHGTSTVSSATLFSDPAYGELSSRGKYQAP